MDAPSTPRVLALRQSTASAAQSRPEKQKARRVAGLFSALVRRHPHEPALRSSGLVLDFLAHLLHGLHFNLANALSGYAVFVGQHLQRFFLIFREPAARDDVA